MSDDSERLEQRVKDLEREVAALKSGPIRRGVRKRSATILWGLPLYDIALGPDPERNESRGHARGIVAIGDIATGLFAMGGIARGFFAFGGLAWGAITFGGCSIGLLLAIGGLAVGLVALGGAAVGLVAVGGGAIGYFACGGGAFGKYVISAIKQDPEAIRFFSQWIPGIDELVKLPKR